MLRDPQRSCELQIDTYIISDNLQYMLRDLQRYLARRQPVDIVYIDRAGRLSQRRVRLLRVNAGHVRAYCYERRAVRTFSLANILAALPVCSVDNIGTTRGNERNSSLTQSQLSAKYIGV